MVDEAKKNGEVVGKAVLVVLAVLALASLGSGYLRSTSVASRLDDLPGLQQELKWITKLAAEYRDCKMYNPEPKKVGQYVRKLMDDAARDLGIERAFTKVMELPVQETERLVEKRYTAKFKGRITRRQAAMFLYKLQYSGGNLTPAGVNLRRAKDSDKWTGELVVHAVSFK